MEEAKKKAQVPVAITSTTIAKPKLNVQKPLSYEELMKKAEMNSKNTLSVADLKVKTTPIAVIKPEPRRSFPVVKKPQQQPKAKPSEKKPVKVIKRSMQPRTETADLVVLNQKKRDLRSIEEIQLELKQQQQQKQKQSKPKPIVTEESDPEAFYAKNYSSIISNIFGYNKNKYNNVDDDDDLLEMETDYRTMMAEEARSSRIGKEEDLQEELKEIERKKKKAALLK